MGKSKSSTKKKKVTDLFEITETEINQRQKEYVNGILVEKINLTAKTDSQKKLLKSIKDNQITICSGPAGTGKTLCSVYMALSLLREQNNSIQKILLVKPVVVLENEELGFLKGDMKEKIEPFMESFKGNAKKLFRMTNVDSLFDSSVIRFQPLAYIRGNTYDNTIIIMDETQNVTLKNARSLLTRIGKNSKVICLGDVDQVDLKDPRKTALEPLLEMFEDESDFGCVRMDEKDENCRNPIIGRIEKKFKERASGVNVKSAKMVLNE